MVTERSKGRKVRKNGDKKKQSDIKESTGMSPNPLNTARELGNCS